MKKDLLSLYDIQTQDIEHIFETAAAIKTRYRSGVPHESLKGKTLGMIFEKPSTRTRVSFESGMYQMGGHAVYLRWKDTQLGRGESIHDTAKVLSRYLDAIMIRTFSQETLEEFALHADVPVINGLTDMCHPCQILADMFTIIEKKGTCRGIKVAYVGDGNNVANSWINAALRLDFELVIGCPEKHTPDRVIYERAKKEIPERITVVHHPAEAVKDADVVCTDTWVSMGQEDDRLTRLEAFKGFQVNDSLLSGAKADVMVLHCLPAHRGEEITDSVMDGRHSAVFDEAENRLHVQKAILEILINR